MRAYLARLVYFYTSWLILIYGSVPFSRELGFFFQRHAFPIGTISAAAQVEIRVVFSGHT